MLDWMMDHNLGLLIDSAAISVQEGAEKASGAGVRSTWGEFGGLAPVLAERCLFGAGLMPVFEECWCLVARPGLWGKRTWLSLGGLGDGGARDVWCL